MSNFTNELIKNKDYDDKIQFRVQAIKILREMFPNRKIKEGDQPDLVFFEEMQCSLQNVHAKYLASSKTTFELKEIIKEHFTSITAVLQNIEQIVDKTFDEVKTLIFPQLMPLEFTDKMPIVNFEFGGGVKIGIVVDDERTYRYATQNDLERWEITEFELYELALENLEQKSAAIPMMALGDDALIIQTRDSFDAVRILLPKIREFLNEHLGSPFNFGIPNRDFLICWSNRTDADLQQSLRQQIKKDFYEQAYPLSESTFSLDSEGQIHSNK